MNASVSIYDVICLSFVQRFNLIQLEEWCRTNQLHESDLLTQFEPITEVVQILQVNKKSVKDADGIISLVKTLNALQVNLLKYLFRMPIKP